MFWVRSGSLCEAGLVRAEGPPTGGLAGNQQAAQLSGEELARPQLLQLPSRPPTYLAPSNLHWQLSPIAWNPTPSTSSSPSPPPPPGPSHQTHLDICSGDGRFTMWGTQCLTPKDGESSKSREDEKIDLFCIGGCCLADTYVHCPMSRLQIKTL